jgi:GTPase SAR1 family protein
MRHIRGVVIVCSLTDPESVKNLKNWRTELDRYYREDVVVFIVANKAGR